MWFTPPSWKRKVAAAMKAKGISRAELSRRVGVSDAAITQLLRPSSPQSRLVPDINRVLGMTPPTQSDGEIDEALAEFLELWEKLDSDARKILLGMAGVAARSKG